MQDARDADEREARVATFLAVADELSDRLGGDETLSLNEAALELAAACSPDVSVIEDAWRRARQRLETAPDHHARQLVSLIRRALEVGTWDWDGRS